MNIVYLCIMWIFITYSVILGYDDLSANRNTAQYKTVISCPECVATRAVDRNISTCTQTDMGITAPDKFTWWYVDLGDIHSVYNIRIQFMDYPTFAMRQRGRFAGFSLYVSNTTDRHSGHLCYKDGTDLPPLDFNTNCATHGRYVIFYNERLAGTNYPFGYMKENVVTELCEVTVTGCLTLGVYGGQCDKPCPENCQKRRCDIINGTCLGCTPGWMGEYCTTGCPPWHYGLKCESNCTGHCKDNKPCNHINGLCDNGCYDGWTGENCTEECPTGTFGSDCVYNCSGNCLDDVICNEITGRCDVGCKPGYTGDLCDKGCGNGMFGIDCSNHCSGNCLHNVPCNSTNGHCDSGCASGYLGFFCIKTCDKGTYGLGCLQNCSLNCKYGLCDNVDGSCICTHTKHGPPLCNDAYSQSKVFNHNCNESFYITGLSILVTVIILLAIACLFFIRKNQSLVKKLHSLQYASITRLSRQPDNSVKESPEYEELRISENSYHNIELRN